MAEKKTNTEVTEKIRLAISSNEPLDNQQNSFSVTSVFLRPFIITLAMRRCNCDSTFRAIVLVH